MTIEQAERPRSRWLVPPRLRTAADRHEERHATWLELFFDLVFVVAITELSHALVVDHSAAGFLRFAALFVPVYVAWQGYSFYADRFDTDDLLLRLAFFAAMLAIAAMAVQVEDLTQGMHSTGFAVSYIVLRSIMVGLYGRAWIAAPEARPLVRLYGSGYAVAVGIWIVSLALPAPTRYVLWGIALALDLSLPPLSTRIHRRVPTSSAHVPGGMVVFILSLVATRVVTVSGHHALGITLKLVTVAVLLFLLALQSALPPVALAAGAALVLAVLVFFERTLFPQQEVV